VPRTKQLSPFGLGTTVGLWGNRWPLVAKEVCISELRAADPEDREEVRWALPCESCELNTACLTARQKEIGGLMYDREYQTRPRASASSLFPYERMEPCLDFNGSLSDYWLKPLGNEERWAICSGWDLAWSEKTGGDYLAKYTAKLDRVTGEKHLLDLNRWQRLSFVEQCDLITEENKIWKDDIVVIESDVAQVVWKQYLEATTAVPVMPHSAGTKRSFEQGVPVLLRDIERKKWSFPYKVGSRKHDLVRAFLGECEAFGWEDDKLQGVGEHDDMVMSWWHCDWGLEKMRAAPTRKVTSQRRRQIAEF